MSIKQPPWKPDVRMYNSLTKSKTEFIPKIGRIVKWYNYILRRIMSDYFGYDVHFAMNITDIDDKIILRARQKYLFERFRDQVAFLSTDLIDRVFAAWKAHLLNRVSKALPDEVKAREGEENVSWLRIEQFVQDKDRRAECLKRDEKFDMYLTAAVDKLSSCQGDREYALQLVDESRDILSASLDEELKHTVTDPSIFRSLASYWENQFFADMDRLRVRRPDILTRVTEYVPEIVDFVKRIIDNGYGYTHGGSVYFDTLAFDSSEKHVYAKLEPWSKGNRELLAEGEGWRRKRVNRRGRLRGARAVRDGTIECSVMASAIFGDNMDIHSGGIDLAFPHHDNEMAQSEAYHECESWVNFFIHTGHLHIEGLKMSKSLKNFITIDEILQRFTPRQLRLAFLSQLWNAKVDFSESLMTGEVRTIESNFNNFFTTVKAILLANDGQSDGYHHYEDAERELMNELYQSKLSFRAALCDSFSTPDALKVLRDLVSRTNIYINSRGKALNVALVDQSARWVGQMLRMFGLGEGGESDLGWGTEQNINGGVNREEVLMPYLRVLSSFRDGVRRLAIAKTEDVPREILRLSDQLRDDDLVPLGHGKALVKLVPPSELIKARDEKRQKSEAQAARKAAAAEEQRQKRLAKLEKGRTYSQWNEQGLPTADGAGERLSKNQEKKLQKLWNDQKKLHEEYLAWQQ
ncbi:hypothetical protein F5141DRAFT_1187015 [Pisolithus sp. B1]|nr:hypothetical protein F5141DRAFT_1187015 [Pisolithus sp. B1]